MTGFSSQSNGDFSNILITEEELVARYKGASIWGVGGYARLSGNISLIAQETANGVIWKQISVGNQGVSAIRSDGTLWSWGSNYAGKLGNNSTANPTEAVTVVPFSSNWKSVSSGPYHTVAVKNDGTIWGWGSNSSGYELGSAVVSAASTPVQIFTGTGWNDVSTGRVATIAKKTDGTIWGIGTNSKGQLGSIATSANSPVQFVTGTDWKYITPSFTDHFAAIKTDGTLWLWGRGTNGELGDNNAIDRSSPVQTVAGGTDWKSVSCSAGTFDTIGHNHTAAIKTDGTLWTWGCNLDGQLGDNTTTYRSSPVQTVAGGSNWRQVATRTYGLTYEQSGTMAVKTDGTLWTWGSNNSVFLNDLIHQQDTGGSRSSPVQITGGSGSWYSVAGRSTGFFIINRQG